MTVSLVTSVCFGTDCRGAARRCNGLAVTGVQVTANPSGGRDLQCEKVVGISHQRAMVVGVLRSVSDSFPRHEVSKGGG